MSGSFPSQGYAGDVEPHEAWEGLKANDQAQLIDVRTRAEWTYVGVADLAAVKRRPVLLEWQGFPGGEANPNFAADLDAALKKAGLGADTPLYFLCRSGARSRAAAMAMARLGYTQAFNVAGGFEGDRNEEGHRGQVNGWKVEGLPWEQG